MADNPSEDPRVKDLLKKYSIKREVIEGYIGEMEDIKNQVSKLFPTQLNDYKAKFVLEEKIKASASFFQTLLSLTQEYNKSIVQEIDIIRKLAMNSQGKEQELKELIKQLEENNPELVEQISSQYRQDTEVTEEVIEEPEVLELQEDEVVVPEQINDTTEELSLDKD
jgi:hypothetical protein